MVTKNYNIKSILVPTDFSACANKALLQAIIISERTGAKLVLIHVVEVMTSVIPGEMLTQGGVTEKMIEVSRKNLKDLAAKIKLENKLDVEYVSYNGRVYDNIIRAAHIHNSDLIIMGTHGTSGVQEWLFGSNAFSVVSNSTIPVLTINLDFQGSSIRRIVFPFNEDLITLKKIEHVILIAKVLYSSVLLFGFTENKEFTSIVSLFNKGKKLAAIFEKEQIACTFSIFHGDNYAEEILNFANEEDADMITVVTSSGNNSDKLLKAKSAKLLINHANIPVLCVPV